MDRGQAVQQVQPRRVALQGDIGQDQGDIGQLGQQRQSLVDTGGLNYRMALFAQHLADSGAQVGAVLDQQYQSRRQRGWCGA